MLRKRVKVYDVLSHHTLQCVDAPKTVTTVTPSPCFPPTSVKHTTETASTAVELKPVFFIGSRQ